jgi:predicted PurR-regulated permease PerM
MEPEHAKRAALEDRTFLLLIAGISLAFAWILWPFYGAILWGIVLAILFAPLFRWLERAMRHRPTLAALATLAIILVMVILPLAVVAEMLVQEGFDLYERIQSGELGVGQYAREVVAGLPAWMTGLLDRFGLLAARAFSVGQNTLDFFVSFFIMLYLLFFLLRDGSDLVMRIKNAIPLREDLKEDLSDRFSNVIRAAIKGNLVVAVVQRALGGLAFWVLGINAPVLWAVLMAFLSLLPAVGTALVWAPVAVYLLATGSVWQGVVLIAYGVLVIGLVDNVLRPTLVGKATRIPDYVVLVSTLGGMAIFGLNGFVIGPVIAAMYIAVWESAASSRARMREADGGR